ncbi:MAG: Dihydrodipicolinate synthase [Bacteriovoracaceae bacterium]|nr:Dihydrodipicolinate synthase [Bacteriovoracaceae bacterium]
MKIEGIYTAIVTPFQDSGSGIEEKIFRNLIERQVEAKVAGIVVAGSTGEGQTLSREEWKEAIKIALTYRNQIQIIGACGSSGTEYTRDRYRELSDLGVHAALISTPSYNKPPQRGIIKHYEKIAASASLPIIVYNIPGRTAVNIAPSTMLELWKLSQVEALKESSGNLEQSLQFIREAPQGKIVLSGDDPLHLAMFAHGARGVVSVVSNVLPQALVSLWNYWSSGQTQKAMQLQNELNGFYPQLFIESNPIPVKWCVGEIIGKKLPLRLPLVELDPAYHAKVKAGLDHLLKLGLS